MGYMTLFPIGTAMRANLFGYRDLHDPWLQAVPRCAASRRSTRCGRACATLMGDFAVTDFVKIRPVDLYVTKGHRQPGVVLVGDAFATSCPAAGTGARKVLIDVERLCNVHIPQWLATPGMGEEKIAAFYDDPVKRPATPTPGTRHFNCVRSASTRRCPGLRSAGPSSPCTPPRALCGA